MLTTVTFDVTIGYMRANTLASPRVGIGLRATYDKNPLLVGLALMHLLLLVLEVVLLGVDGRRVGGENV